MRAVVTTPDFHTYDSAPEHKRGCFPCCRLAWLLRATPDKAQHELHRGGISQAEFEAYMHVWATSVPRFSSVGCGWTDLPSDAEVASIADHLSVAMKAEAAQ